MLPVLTAPWGATPADCLHTEDDPSWKLPPSLLLVWKWAGSLGVTAALFPHSLPLHSVDDDITNPSPEYSGNKGASRQNSSLAQTTYCQTSSPHKTLTHLLLLVQIPGIQMKGSALMGTRCSSSSPLPCKPQGKPTARQEVACALLEALEVPHATCPALSGRIGVGTCWGR